MSVRSLQSFQMNQKQNKFLSLRCFMQLLLTSNNPNKSNEWLIDENDWLPPIHFFNDRFLYLFKLGGGQKKYTF